MKKIISALTSIIISLSLCACGNTDSSTDVTNTTTTTTTASTTTTTAQQSQTTTTTTTQSETTTTTTTTTTEATTQSEATTTSKVSETEPTKTTTEKTTTAKTTTTKVTTTKPKTTTTTTTKKPETTTTTTKKPVDVPSKEVMLDIVGVKGYTDLESGSGITAAATVLKYYGINVEVLKLKQYADIYGLNTIEDGVTPSPWDVIVGEPLTATAKYYAKPIVDMVNNYANKNGLNNIKAKDISGATLDELMSYINKGKPVIVWGTRTGKPAEDGISWILPNGEKFVSKAKISVYVVIGYNSSEIIIMNDNELVRRLEKNKFVSMYESVYSQAILIE